MNTQHDSTPSTYMGIAFYTLNGHPTQWVIVLSSCELFSRDLWCGTIIESINGWVESWRRCDMGLTKFAQHLFLSGIVMVAKINRLATDIKDTISSLPWKAEQARLAGYQYPPSNEYVHRVLFYLDGRNVISLPPSARSDFVSHMKERFSILQGFPKSHINQFFVIPIA